MPNVKKNNQKNNKDQNSNLFIWVFAILGVIYLINVSTMSLDKATTPVSYGRFFSLLENNLNDPQIQSAVLTDNLLRGKYIDGRGFVVNVAGNDPQLLSLLRKNVPDFDIKPPKTLFINLFYSMGPMLLFIGFLWFFVYRNAMRGGGNNVFSFGKSRAQVMDDKGKRTTFDDVAGVEEAKEELKEIIDFLKEPKKFEKLGGRIPKGVLLVGSPGTGKTLLAKAAAGEAGVPFLSLTGSDFVEMFVGVGASRVRDLFDKAKKSIKTTQKGCIIFIDEIDAVGRQRFSGIGGGHDEREQTLNALLSEMDGFNSHQGIIIMAATNRPDVLDPALLRPGRFDRQIVVQIPDIVGRESILKVHARKIKMSSSVMLSDIARQTPGFSGADLENLINEAALLSARRNKNEVESQELIESIERVIAGPERKSTVIRHKDKITKSYHEAGHALLSLLMKNADRFHKVSIIPRGVAAGYTLSYPEEDKETLTEEELRTRIVILLGGRVSEEMNFNEATTGASDDLKKATEIARNMVLQYGMSEKLKYMSFGPKHEHSFLGRDITEDKVYSEHTAQLIDDEVRKIIETSYQKTKEVLKTNFEKLKLLADTLMEKEVMDSDEVRKLLGLTDTTLNHESVISEK